LRHGTDFEVLLTVARLLLTYVLTVPAVLTTAKDVILDVAAVEVADPTVLG
jgi:hypothetical protein